MGEDNKETFDVLTSHVKCMGERCVACDAAGLDPVKSKLRELPT